MEIVKNRRVITISALSLLGFAAACGGNTEPAPVSGEVAQQVADQRGDNVIELTPGHFRVARSPRLDLAPVYSCVDTALAVGAEGTELFVADVHPEANPCADGVFTREDSLNPQYFKD